VLVSAYRARHIGTYETDRNLLAWGARSWRFARRSPEQVERASRIELVFWARLSGFGLLALIGTRVFG
jgi:hypothetical protein